ncbi:MULTISPECIES: DUF3153 domain-containing protein [Micrococcaceae]|uniref:LppM family (lipo)protein n=1 Tax=Micrococcaceae TaxID=1268 RepID=UPI0010356C77|nr:MULTISPECIES: DUF3153 domain-containing protein [Micrococcaceae]TAP25585.1 DUF3153 domain-containing protein [Arthrobacter sp. S41]UXN31527.1 DUF3153 domain-containing protein [Glutamicibacter sp. M10]
MKKVFSVIALVFTAVLALSGCVNMNAEINVVGQDKTTGVVEVTINKENLQGQSLDEVLAATVDTAAMEKEIEGQWTYSKVEEGENVGLRFETDGTKTYTQLADAFKIFGFQFGLADDGKEVTFSMPGDKATVDQNFTEANLEVNFPGEVTSNGPGVVHGKAVTFDLVKGAEVYQATGKFDHSLLYSLVFGGALLVLSLIFVVVFAPKGVKESH